MSSFEITKLAIPAGTALISFLAYSSQYLFLYIEPAPLDKNQLIRFNILVACIWICYVRACFTEPGHVPSNWKPANAKDNLESDSSENDDLLFDSVLNRQRWCRRCDTFKPPRAHHCKSCRRCIPKMDHHCPWTGNCVSHPTFPHFIRFLVYGVASMSYLEHFLYIRASIVWKSRHMPSAQKYYGPSISQLAHLLILLVVNSTVLLLLSILLIRTIWMLAQNMTTIEGWEIERHKTLVRRARVFGGFLDAPDGTRIRIRKQEFPYDIGIWKNIRDGMGGSNNILLWLFPLSPTPSPAAGLEFEVNGFEDPSLSWPPPDPDRLPRKPQPPINPQQNPLLSSSSSQQPPDPGANFTPDSIAAFRHRQDIDLFRRRHIKHAVPRNGTTPRQRPFHERYAETAQDAVERDVDDVDVNGSASGEEGWRTAEGDRLRDFGVDEDVEFYDYEVRGEEEEDDEDDIPLAKLIERRKWERERDKME